MIARSGLGSICVMWCTLVLLLACTLASCDPYWQAKLQNDTDSSIRIIATPVLGSSYTPVLDTTINGFPAIDTTLHTGESMHLGDCLCNNGEPRSIAFSYLEVHSKKDTIILPTQKVIFERCDQGKYENVLHIR